MTSNVLHSMRRCIMAAFAGIVMAAGIPVYSAGVKAAPETSFNCYRDEEAIFMRYYSKAFLGNNPGFGGVFLNTEDYNNFFAMMEIELGRKTDRLFIPNLIYGASWLKHKLEPSFFGTDSEVAYTGYRGSMALSYRPFDFFVAQFGGHVMYYKMDNPDKFPELLAENENLSSYESVPKKKLKGRFFFLYNLDASMLKSKLMTDYDKKDGLDDFSALIQAKLGEAKLHNIRKTVLAFGPLLETRNASLKETVVDTVNSKLIEVTPQALRTGLKLDLFDTLHAEVHNRVVERASGRGLLGISSTVWDKAFTDESQTDYIIGVTLPVIAPIYAAYHKSEAEGKGFEAGIDVAEWMRRESGADFDADWKITLSKNVVSDDPLLQIPDRWAFKFYYIGHYE